MKIEYTDGFKEDMKRLFSMNPIYLIPRKLDDWKHEIKWAWQRVLRGWDDRWAWNFNTELATVAVEALKEMVKYKHGHPMNLNSTEEWKDILTDIIRGFQAYQKLHSMEYQDFEHDALEHQKEKGLDLFRKWYENLWD